MMFDLQIARRANPSTELNYFLASGVSPEFKLQHENGLLAEYHRALSDRLSAYGFPDTTHTVDDVRRDYMSKSTLAFVFGILHSQVRGRERERESKPFYGLFVLTPIACTHVESLTGGGQGRPVGVRRGQARGPAPYHGRLQRRGAEEEQGAAVHEAEDSRNHRRGGQEGRLRSKEELNKRNFSNVDACVRVISQGGTCVRGGNVRMQMPVGARQARCARRRRGDVDARLSHFRGRVSKWNPGLRSIPHNPIFLRYRWV